MTSVRTVDAPPIRSRYPLIRAVLGSAQGRIGAALTTLLIAIVTVGPLLRPGDPQALVTLPGDAPSGAHLLGGDVLGRDVLSRVLSGGRSILFISVIGVVIAYAIGLLVGLTSAYVGGWVDAVVIRLLDLLYSLPTLLIFILAVSTFGQSATTLAILLAFAYLPAAARVVRGVARSVVTNDYIRAAELRGEPIFRILVRELLPNAAGPLIADCAFMLTSAVLAVATLNYLGLGTQPPTPDWGSMISENQNIIAANPVAVLAPAVLIALLTLGINLVADVIGRYVSRESNTAVIHL